MNNKSLVIITVIMISGIASGALVCMRADQFSNDIGRLPKTAAIESHRTKYSSYLSILTDYSSKIESYSIEEVFDLSNLDVKKLMRKVNIKDEKVKKDLELEIGIMRKICGHTSSDYSVIADCKSKPMVPFFGCVEDKDFVYVFVNKETQSLASPGARRLYAGLPALKTVKVMLDILDRFVEIHRRKIIHGSIRPENIMTKGAEISDFKIFDFGYANYENNPYLGGEYGYLPPERYGSTKYFTSLSYTDDVFSLGITFAELRGGFDEVISKLKDGCYFDKRNVGECNTSIDSGVSNAFKASDGYSSILPLIRKAVSYSAGDRYQTMEKFSLAMVKAFVNLPGADKIISRVVDSGSRFDEDSERPSFWKHYIVSNYASRKPAAKEQKVQKAPVEQSNFLIEWFSGLMSCASSRKEADSEAEKGAKGKDRTASSKLDKTFAAASRLHKPRI